jgi:hypothetical protein
MLGKCACHPTTMLEHRLNRSATTIQKQPSVDLRGLDPGDREQEG